MSDELLIADCSQLPSKRLRAICEGRAHLPLFKINRYRRLWGLSPLKLATPEVEFGSVKVRVGISSDTESPPRVSKRRGCGGCGRSIVKKALDFATAAARFIGDGCQTVSDKELSRRKAACETCPLRDGAQCSACGCVLSLKHQMRLEACPVGKWLPDLRPRRSFDGEPRRNLLMHIMPVSGNGVWQWNCAQIAARQGLFDGRRILAIATMPTRRKIKERPRKELETDTAADVLGEFDRLGMAWDDIIEIKNDSRLREVATFMPMMGRIRSDESNEVTFFCHAKGVTHSLSSIPHEWASALYETCLDDWPTVRSALECYSMAGSLRRFGQFTTPGNHRWHYSGTFYWFRHSDIFTRDWRHIDKMFFGTESWPGLMFSADQCACLWADNAPDPYQSSSWANYFRHELDQWRAARGRQID